MKICTNCNMQQPDNFISCAHCGAPLPQQPTGGVPMQMFMYDRTLINKNGSQSLISVIIKCVAGALGIVLLFAAAVFALSYYDLSEGFIIGMLILFAVVVLIVAVAFALYMKSKLAKSYIAYIYYNGILYKIIMQSKMRVYPVGRSVGAAVSTAYAVKSLYELDEKSKYADEFLKLFARYTSGEKLWDPMTGGLAYIEPLNGFRVTGEDEKYYKYTYINQNGSTKAAKMDKAYPGIETIFNYCR